MVVLVLRQGTGLALSTLTLPPGCSQKKVASLMNTSLEIVRCFEVTEEGIRAVNVPELEYILRPTLVGDLKTARQEFAQKFRQVKPRVAPRMAVGVVVAQEVSHAHA